MWLATTLGFFSCTRAPLEPDCYQIRARTEADIRGLREALHIEARVVETPPPADYRWRIVVERDIFFAIFQELAERVNYGNFKKAVHETPGQEDKAGPYLRIWATMATLQDPPAAEYEPEEPSDFFERQGYEPSPDELLSNPQAVEDPPDRRQELARRAGMNRRKPKPPKLGARGWKAMEILQEEDSSVTPGRLASFGVTIATLQALEREGLACANPRGDWFLTANGAAALEARR